MKKLCALLFALALPSCSGAPFDAQAMFEQQFGTRPIVIGVPSTETALSSAGDPASCILAQLVQSGRARFSPMPDAEPYVSLSLGDGQNGAGMALFSGRRVYESSSDAERFTRNANDYFAHTVTYYIRSENSLVEPPNPSGFGPFRLRAVYARDPAVGQWRPESFTPLSGGEIQGSDQGAVNVILSDLMQRGCPTGAMVQAAQAARTQAMDRIAQRLSDSGVLARGPVPDTVVSRRNNRIWFVGRIDTTNMRWRDMFTLCGRIGVRAGRNWRPPSSDDLVTIMQAVPNQTGVWTLQDTPDRRYFGGIINPRGQIRLAVSDLRTYDGEATTLARSRGQASMFLTYVFRRNYDQQEYRVDMSITGSDPGNALPEAQLLCVGDYGQ